MFVVEQYGIVPTSVNGFFLIVQDHGSIAWQGEAIQFLGAERVVGRQKGFDGFVGFCVLPR